MSDILKALNWRYATKKFDKNKKLGKEQVEELLEVIRLAPTSYGISHWRAILVEDENTREKIKEAAYGQSQVTDASNLIIFAIKKDLNSSDVRDYMNLISKIRSVSLDDLKGFEDMLNGDIENKTKNGEINNWSKRQAYIALGMLMLACADNGIDSCPMEGFNNKQVDEILNLSDIGLECVCMCPIGFRSEDDEFSKYAKVRLPKEKLIIEIK